MVDARGLRVSASVTSLLAISALVALALGGSAVAFAPIGVLLAIMVSGLAGRTPVRPLQKRLAPLFGEPRLEPAAGPRFAQMCGVVLLAAASALILSGQVLGAVVALAVLAGLSSLLALFDVCLGCMMYGVLFRRVAGR